MCYLSTVRSPRLMLPIDCPCILLCFPLTTHSLSCVTRWQPIHPDVLPQHWLLISSSPRHYPSTVNSLRCVTHWLPTHPDTLPTEACWPLIPVCCPLNMRRLTYCMSATVTPVDLSVEWSPHPFGASPTGDRELAVQSSLKRSCTFQAGNDI